MKKVFIDHDIELLRKAYEDDKIVYTDSFLHITQGGKTDIVVKQFKPYLIDYIDTSVNGYVHLKEVTEETVKSIDLDRFYSLEFFYIGFV